LKDWAIFWSGIGHTVEALAGFVALGFTEVGSGGLATAGVVVGGVSLGTLLVKGTMEIGGGLSDGVDKGTIEIIDKFPQSSGELAGMAFGEKGKKAGGLIESTVNFGSAGTMLEQLQAFIDTYNSGYELSTALNDTSNNATNKCGQSQHERNAKHK
jgi:hypothetical protein